MWNWRKENTDVDRKAVCGIILMLLLTGMLTLAFNIQPVKAEPGMIIVPDDYPTIQEAVNHAGSGDTVYVRAGIYYEHIVVDKNDLTIKGEDSLTTIIDGSGSGNVLRILSGEVSVTSFTIRNSGSHYVGIGLIDCDNNNITSNIITENFLGVHLLFSSNNIVINNTITNNVDTGIGLDGAWNSYGNNTFIMNKITDNGKGIMIYRSSNNIVNQNAIFNNIYGISISGHSSGFSNENIIIRNVLSSNTIGMSIKSEFSINNIIYHNNFINNTSQAYTENFVNAWDDGYPSCGNYWSDYTGADLYSGPYQNETGSDCIGDITYVIDANNTDRYPRMHPWSPLPVHNINTGLGYTTIQEAINANETINAHIIFVEAGTYYENVVVNKGVLLIGENRETTIIDGSGTDFVVLVRNTNNVTISGFTIQRSGYEFAGIYLFRSNNGTVNNNILKNNDWAGIRLQFSDNNTISGNKMTDNYCPIACQWSNMIIIKNNNLINNQFGMDLFHSNSSTIIRNNITENGMFAISILGGRNIVIENTIAYSNRGILFYGLESETCDNKIYHNNFISNVVQVETDDLVSFWDNGYPSGGNYWSDYVGVDVKNGPNQDLLGSDCIGDTPYTIDENNQDRYPLMKPWTLMPTTYTFPIVWGEETFIVSVESNSTISNFTFNQPNKEISFNVSGPNDTIGFCSAIIPNQLLDGPWTVLIDAQPPLYFTPVENETHSILYFTYTHSTHQIQIIGTWAIGDTTPPLIDTPSQEPESDKVTPDTAVTVYVNVTDIEIGVKNVILSYKKNGAATWNNITMLYNATTALYQATIPAFPSGTTVCYKIIAYDNADNVAINDNAGQYYCYTVSALVPPLSASISPLSASILVGQSVTFTSTVSGGVTPYSYQWHLNGAPVSGATSASWTFTPTTSGIYYIYLKVTDDTDNTTQSETARITVTTVPVGGYSVPIQLPTIANPATIHIALLTILTAIFITIKRKTKRKH